jgi:Protein kinase domain
MSIDPEARIGTELAGFRIQSLIGRGGMGVVYGAEQLRYGRRVALKVLAPELSHDPQFRERFEQEWRTAARIEHPSIVPIYEAGEADEGLYIAMRFIDGTDLSALVTRAGRLEPARALNILGQIADALDSVHAHGLVHRDVKPANILVASGAGHEYAYLGDFGVAKQLHTESGLTQTGAFIGTVDYAAPEQLEGKTVDGRADIYALACVLYQILTGARPFDRDSQAATISAHLFEPPPSANAVQPDLPAELDGVIARALAKSPADRYATCRDLLAEAGAALGLRQPTASVAGEGAAALEDGTPTIPATGPASPPGGQRDDSEARGSWFRTLPGILVIVAVLLAVGIVLGIVLTRGGGEDDATEAAPPATTAQTPPATAEPPAAEGATTAGPATTEDGLSAGPFALELGDVVSPGSPSAGAGEIAEPGELDVFTIEAAGGEQIFLDVQPIDGECPVVDMGWRLEHVDSATEVFDSTIFNCSEPNDEDGYTLREGTYRLTVYGANGVTGTYRFLFAPVVVEEFATEIGDVVSPGEPEAGAGEIAAPAELDVFTFEAEDGQRIFFDVQPIDGECPVVDMGWKLEHVESGTELFDSPIFNCSEPSDKDGFTLDGGTYALTVYGAGGVTGTYRFRLVGL